MEQKNIFEKKFSEYFINRQCTICLNDNWLIPDELFDLREYMDNHESFNNSNPFIPVVCSKCGNTHLINPRMYDINL